MTLIPGQPYPDLTGWEDVRDLLQNGWNTGKNGLFMNAHADGNNVDIMGRVVIGTSRTAMLLPPHLRPTSNTQGMLGVIIPMVPVIVEIRPAGDVNLSNFSLGMTETQMIEQFGGSQLFFQGSYPRRSPV